MKGSFRKCESCEYKMIKKDNKKHGGNLGEHIKTAVLCMLVVTLVILVVVYIRRIQVYEKVIAEKSPESFNKLWSVQSGAEPHGIDSSRLLPEFIGYKQASFVTPRGCVGSSGAVGALYDLVKPCLIELFGSDSVCIELHPESGRELFESAKGKDEFIYIRYHVPVMYQVIYAYGVGELTVSEENVAVGEEGAVGAYISELIIVSENNGGSPITLAYATDSDGNYYEFRPTKYSAESSFYISKLANDDVGITTSDFTFVTDGALVSSEPMISSELLCNDIIVSLTDLSGEEIKNGLLRLLGYNPDKLDAYDDKGADVYIDSHSRLRLGGGSVSFVTYDATAGAYDGVRGLSLDTLLGYTLDKTPTFFDKLTAADNFIRLLGEISPKLVGGEASLCLGEVYREDDLLIVEYFPTYNNVRIGDEVGLRIVFAENTLCEFELFPVTVDVGENEHLLTTPAYVLEQLKVLGKISQDTPCADVRIRYSGGSAEWTAVLE